MTDLTKSTQSKHPWRATARTVFAGAVSLAAIWGLVVEAAGVDSTNAIVGGSLAVAGGVTRVLAIPAVEAWLERFVPFLAAKPKPTP